MIIWCNKLELCIKSDIAPQTTVRKPLPSDSKEEKQEKKAFPYINKLPVIFNINYLGNAYEIYIPKGYKWDGATIPRIFWWIIGSKGESDFLDASMVHDIITEHKELVNFDRQLSSMVLREILLSAGVAKWRAYTMFICVELYQKFWCGW